MPYTTLMRHGGARSFAVFSSTTASIVYDFGAQVFEAGVRYVVEGWSRQTFDHDKTTILFGVAGVDEETKVYQGTPGNDPPDLWEEYEVGADGETWTRWRVCWTPSAERTGVRVRWSAIAFGTSDFAVDDLALYTTTNDELAGTATRAARCDHGHLHNLMVGRSVSEAHPASAVSETVDGDVQTALDRLRGRAWKEPVRAATTVNGALATAYENGDTVDGVVLATGDRILLKDQTTGSQNGIYTVNASGAPTRATDLDASSEVLGAAVLVMEGTANADRLFRCTNNGPITLGTTALVFSELGGAAALIVQEDDTTVDAAATTLDFGTALNVTSSPAGEANVSVDLGTGAGQAAAGDHIHAAGDSSKASATSDLTATTTTAADVTGATLSLPAGTYIVIGNFDVSVKSNADRLFEGLLDVGGTDENDLAVLQAVGLDTDDRAQVVQVWRVVLASTTTVKLQARHSGGSAGDFTVNAANTTLTAYRAGGAGVGATDIERRTAGNLTISSITAGDAVPTLGVLIVAAVAGDVLQIGLSAAMSSDSISGTRLDVGTIVSAAVVNYVSSLSGTPATVGIPAWLTNSGEAHNMGHSILYVVQAGDISGGNVELSLRGWNSAVDNRTLQASTTSPLVFWVKNLLQS